MLFEVTSDDIARLGDADLRTLVGRLCEEETRLHGYSPAAVTWGGNQNAADGGIDVRVSLADGAVITGYVAKAATGLQVKAQDMPPGAILKEMAPGGILRPSIAELAAKGGAYIIVSSQGSVSDTAWADRKDAMLEAVEGKIPPGSLVVEFYDRTRLATWVNQHPGLVPWVLEKVGRPLSGWRAFGDWSSSPAPIEKPYLVDDRVRLVSPTIQDAKGLTVADGINHLREILAQPHGIVRLVGLSGVGKTRLVQALFDNRIGANPLPPAEAVYADISEEPDPVPLELATHLVALRKRAILIVDNCGPDLHQRLVTRITGSHGLVSLITVEYDINDDEPERTTIFKLEVVSVDLMEKILADRFPEISAPSRHVIAEFSGGNARIAFALAVTAKKGDSLAELKDRELFERLFYQTKDKDKQLLNAAKACALLYSFDGDTQDGAEAELPLLAGLVGITQGQLFESVSELHRRQLVQKRGKWRAILPHAIAHRLAKLALEDIPFQKIEDALVKGGPQRVLKSFSKRIGYLHGNEQAIALVTKWFGDDGLLEPIGNYNEIGTALFINVAPIDPDLTLKFIESAARRKDWFFGPENQNRHDIVRVIRSLAYDAPLFDRAAALITKFALPEGDENHDNSRDVLKSLFYLHLSGTHATAFQRAAFFRPLLQSKIRTESDLGLKLLRAMLECSQFSSHYSFDFGARSRDYGFLPRTRAEVEDWFSQAFQLCRDVGLSDHPVAAEVKKMFANNIRPLCSRVGMIDEITSIVDAFSGGKPWSEGWIGLRSAIKRLKGKAPGDDVRKIEAAADRLKPVDIADMVRSYALSKEWSALDIADLEEGEEREPGKARERVLYFCVELGQQLAADDKQLDLLLHEILISRSQKTFWLGKGIASACTSIPLCWDFLMQRYLSIPEADRSVSLLGGFLDEAMRRGSAEVEAILDKVFSDPRLHSDALYLQSNAGIAAGGFTRLMEGLDVETIPVSSYMQVAPGRVHEGLDDDQLSELSRKLQTKEGGIDVAGEIIGMRILPPSKDAPPPSETIKRAGREFLGNVDFKRESPHADYLLGVIIRASLDGPAHEPVARAICERIKDAVANHQANPWDVGDIIENLTKVAPVAVLDVLVETDKSDSSRSVFRELREDQGCPLQSIPDATLLDWANVKPNERYSALAQTVRYSGANDDDNATGWSSIAEEIINYAPSADAVLSIFLDRFVPMSWSGSRAQIMATRLPLMKSLLNHRRPDVAAWAKVHITDFIGMVEKMRGSEAREDRNRDERFE